MSHANQPLFSRHEHALEKKDYPCPKCGADLVLKHSKTGTFWGCSAYPTCDYIEQSHEHERVEDKILSGSACPLCQHPLAVKQGRYGMFIGCSNYPECHYIEEEQNKDAGVVCPKCQQGELLEKVNRFGKTFYACNRYPQCKYIINFQPIAQACPQCHWPIMVKRPMANGEVLMCPEKQCGYKQSI